MTNKPVKQFHTLAYHIFNCTLILCSLTHWLTIFSAILWILMHQSTCLTMGDMLPQDCLWKENRYTQVYSASVNKDADVCSSSPHNVVKMFAEKRGFT